MSPSHVNYNRKFFPVATRGRQTHQGPFKQHRKNPSSQALFGEYEKIQGCVDEDGDQKECYGRWWAVKLLQPTLACDKQLDDKHDNECTEREATRDDDIATITRILKAGVEYHRGYAQHREHRQHEKDFEAGGWQHDCVGPNAAIYF